VFDIIGSICVGDKTSCGRRVVTGDWTTDVDGRILARLGDKTDCKYRCTIVTGGDPTWIVAGSPVALHGATTSRGCTCFSGNNDHHGTAAGSSERTAYPHAADHGIACMPETACLLNEDNWIEFRLTDKDDKPFSGLRYVLVDPSGTLHEGKLDDTGYARIEPVKTGQCKVEFPEIGYVGMVESCPR